MILLAIDTSASLCAAAIFDGGRELGRAVEDIGKGHAERLIAVIDHALAAAGKSYADLDMVAVAVGPGSFTGIRVGVATARGLALALKIPAIGVNNLEAVAAATRCDHPQAAIMTAFVSGRGDIQAAVYDPFANLVYDPAIMNADAATRIAADNHAVIAGSAGPLLAQLNPALKVAKPDVTADIAVYARLAAAKPVDGSRPKPLYLREPDAKPQAGFVLPRAGR